MAELKVWCETCEGTGTIHEESQLGVAGTGGDRQCPDCKGEGYHLRTAAPLAPAQPEPVNRRLLEVLRDLLAKVRRDAPVLSGKLLGDADAAIAEAEAQQTTQPMTWYDGAPPFPQDQEWFIAETIHGDRVVLRSLDEGREHKHTYDFKTADGTYMATRIIARWMQFPDCEYLPPAQPVSREALSGSERAELEHLRTLVNTPELQSFRDGVVLEAAHQRERWGSDHDAGKAPSDWFWLVGYLAGKALHAQVAGNAEKALHHTISTAAALANWHASITGEHTAMRPGIDPAAHCITGEGA